MDNPFDKHKMIYESGFYFDKKYKCIVFYYSEKTMLNIPKIYSRIHPNIESNFTIESPHTDLVMLEFFHIQHNIKSFMLDIQWLVKNSELLQLFKNYLLTDEQYEILACLEITVKKLNPIK